MSNKFCVDNTYMDFAPAGKGWAENRRNYYDNTSLYEYDASILVVGYNRVEEKTRPCVESILKYTEGVSYQLILVDSGSEDDTEGFFDSVTYENKVVVRIEKNLGSGYASRVGWAYAKGKYRVFVANDCILTTNWLTNLIKCIESDPRIGFVCPASSNISNNQEVYIGDYQTSDEMQELAREYNISDPSKWEERPRLVNPVSVARPEMLDMIESFDPGFRHDFGEDNLARCIHRAGYRLMLCKDTFIEHNHPDSERDNEKWRESLDAGRKEYLEKYKGIDPWDDVNNYVSSYIEGIDKCVECKNGVKVLGVNIRCGTPFMDIRNRLRRIGITEENLYAYTDDMKYVPDLLAYPAEVVYGKTDQINTHYPDESMDVAVTTEEILETSDVGRLVRTVKKGGYALFPVKNKSSILTIIDSYLDGNKGEKEHDSPDEKHVLDILESYGVESVMIYDEKYQERLRSSIHEMLWNSLPDDISEEIGQRESAGDEMYTERFWYFVKK